MNHNEKHPRTNDSAPFSEEEQPESTPAPAVRKAISPAKLAANRRNGQKSKGPKTEEGKSRSRWNALKHGVLSQRLVVLNDNDGQTYTLLLENLRRDLNPRNALEEILVEKIAMAYWRLHIAYGYEAEFARSRHAFIIVADRMGRYANTIHRQLLQAMNELERLQRRRNGEAVPAPINVDVNVNALENGWTDGREGPWDLSHRVGSGSTLAPGRLIGTRDLAMASNRQPASFSSDAAVQFCETNPPLDQTSTGDRSGQRD
jgi:hypothetical protein